MDQFEVSVQERLSVERQLARANGAPYAVPCAFPVPSIGAPMPTLLRSENKAYLIYYLEGPEDRVGQVEFHPTWGAKMGYPDENAIVRHPLYGNGLDGYSPMEVINSDWIAEIVRMADSAELTLGSFTGRHFIIPFHDSTFECVAETYSASELDQTYKEAVREAAQLL